MIKITVLSILISIFLTGIPKTKESNIVSTADHIGSISLDMRSCNPLVISSEYLENSATEPLNSSGSILLQYFTLYGTQLCAFDCQLTKGNVCCRIVVPGPEVE